MFANYPLVVQILGWGVFMGLNAYVGACCPLLNLAVLAFVGSYASKKTGIVLLVIALIITAAELVWSFLWRFSASMASIPQSAPTFIEQGSGILNLVTAGIVFFVLLDKFGALFPTPKWLTITIVALFYIIGAWSGVAFWFFSLVSSILLIAVGLLVALCYTRTAPFAIGIGVFLFLGLATIYGYGFLQLYQETTMNKKQVIAWEQFLKAVDNNQPEQVAALWNSVEPTTTKRGLEHALTANNEEMLRFLIKQGADTDNVLMSVIYDKNFGAVQMLVKAGAPIEPHHVSMAAEKRFILAVRLFVEKGVDINQELYRPLCKASELGYLEMAKYLLKTGKNSQETLNEALWVLSSAGEKTNTLELAHLLLEQGAQVNSQLGLYKTTPLHQAAERGSLKLVKLLVINGANVNAVGSDGFTPLMSAVCADNLEIVKFLLKQGADKTINQPAADGKTAIFEARSAEMAKLLLANGADVSHIDENAQSVLFNAVARHLNVDLLKVLVQNGADINKQDNTGTTALLKAASYPFSEDNNLVKFLLENGANVNLANNKGETPLLVASELEVLQVLLTYGADVNSQNEEGETALIHIAQIMDEAGEKTKCLLEYGADVNMQDKKGKTALGYASSRDVWPSKKRIEILKQYGGKK